jgi:hypothetical protein
MIAVLQVDDAYVDALPDLIDQVRSTVGAVGTASAYVTGPAGSWQTSAQPSKASTGCLSSSRSGSCS